MSAVAAPYGLRPLRRSNGAPFVGALKEYPIASGTAAMFRGSPVRLNAGLLVPVTGNDLGAGTNDAYIGVLNGVRYTDATGNVIYNDYFPNAAVATNAVGFVYDDPNIVYAVQASTASQDVDAAVATAFLLANAAAGSTATGQSTAALNIAGGADVGHPFRIMGRVRTPDNPNASGFVDVEVRINTGFHINER